MEVRLETIKLNSVLGDFGSVELATQWILFETFRVLDTSTLRRDDQDIRRKMISTTARIFLCFEF